MSAILRCVCRDGGGSGRILGRASVRRPRTAITPSHHSVARHSLNTRDVSLLSPSSPSPSPSALAPRPACSRGVLTNTPSRMVNASPAVPMTSLRRSIHSRTRATSSIPSTHVTSTSRTTASLRAFSDTMHQSTTTTTTTTTTTSISRAQISTGSRRSLTSLSHRHSSSSHVVLLRQQQHDQQHASPPLQQRLWMSAASRNRRDTRRQKHAPKKRQGTDEVKETPATDAALQAPNGLPSSSSMLEAYKKRMATMRIAGVDQLNDDQHTTSGTNPSSLSSPDGEGEGEGEGEGTSTNALSLAQRREDVALSEGFGRPKLEELSDLIPADIDADNVVDMQLGLMKNKLAHDTHKGMTDLKKSTTLKRTGQFDPDHQKVYDILRLPTRSPAYGKREELKGRMASMDKTQLDPDVYFGVTSHPSSSSSSAASSPSSASSPPSFSFSFVTKPDATSPSSSSSSSSSPHPEDSASATTTPSSSTSTSTSTPPSPSPSSSSSSSTGESLQLTEIHPSPPAVTAPTVTTNGGLGEAPPHRPRTAYTETVNELIHLQSTTGDVKLVRDTLQWMRDRSIDRDVITYSSAMHAAAISRQPDLAFQLLDEMRDEGIDPNVTTYNTLVHACTLARQLDRAFQVVDQMRKEAVMPTPIVFTTLIKGCLMVNNIDRAWETFDYMRQRTRYQPDQVTFTVMMNACAKRKEAERAANLFEEMQQLGLRPTEITFNTLMHCYARRADLAEDAFLTFEKMKAEGYVPDFRSFATLMAACIRNGDVKSAEMVKKEMEEQGLKMNAFTYNSMIGVLTRAQRDAEGEEADSNIKRANELMTEMDEAGVEVNSYTLDSYLGVFCNANRIEEAHKVMGLYVRFNVRPGLISYTQLMKMYAQQGMPAETSSVFAKMLADGIKPDQNVYSHLVYGCAKAGHINSAMKFLREMTGKGMRMCPTRVKALYSKVVRFPDLKQEIWTLCGSGARKDRARTDENLRKKSVQLTSRDMLPDPDVPDVIPPKQHERGPRRSREHRSVGDKLWNGFVKKPRERVDRGKKVPQLEDGKNAKERRPRVPKLKLGL
eukprot:TRINITY_DN1123_c2_g2_i1.p1 TRINITY_DN1123_c2_g2~~TRINITY_DN1123_c2_g2_i1.p1  ORF type:complete len:1059 (+),score=264.02 TRINITY_DN1123_c2_g2_i1:237-3413(+)